MHEIRCPHCGKAFNLDDAGYADLLGQVRNEAFDKEVHDRLALAEKANEAAVEAAVYQAQSALKEAAAKQDAEIARLEQELKTAAELAHAKASGELQAEAAKKDAAIAVLRADLEKAALAQELAVKDAVARVEKQRADLERSLESKAYEAKLLESSLKEKYETQIHDRDDQIERLKDLKARLSTKMLGESLEQHCEIEFNKLRATAFPTAYFEKDNDASSGSKGDFIFRESDDAGTEFISIMFEMKNEADETATKKKNEDFFKELDKDRNEKGCEYAVLVTLLEPESDLYNSGIVDVSHRYPKMYVVRPQFFIPIITLLRNAAQNTLAYKTELALVKEQNIDITNFENELEAFKTGFSRNYDLASRKFKSAIDEIDKTIKSLEKLKAELLGSENNLRLANNKAQDVTIKRLTRGNPTMAAKFADVSALAIEGADVTEDDVVIDVVMESDED